MRRYFLFSPLALIIAATNSYAVTTAGKTMIAKGNVAAFDTQSESRKLRRRSPIYDVDTVTTQEKSKAQFRMNDGTLVAVKANSKVLISEYRYVPGAENNSAVLELVEGGLRSVTGAIKANNGDYKLKTPVGSIGIRGTHFEIELVDGDLFLAVWDGAIDLTVDTGTGTDSTVSFGEGEDFSFGVVTDEGEVTQLLEAPENFDQGHSEDNSDTDDGDSGDSSDDESGNSDNDSSSDSGESDDGSTSESSGDGDSSSSASDDSSSSEGESTSQTSDTGSDTTDSGQPSGSADSSSGSDNSTGGSSDNEGQSSPSSDTSGASTEPSNDNNQNPTSGSSTANTSSSTSAPSPTQNTTPSSQSTSSENNPVDPTITPSDDSTDTIQDLTPEENDPVESQIAAQESGLDPILEPEATLEEETEDPGEELIEETITESAPADVSIIANRTGSFTYNNLVESSVSASAGGAGNLQVSMTVDFDNGWVPEGELSLTDNGGEWFAAFNGAINVNQLDLGINFATHGNELADGNIDALFTDEGNRLTGSFNLFETNGSATARGSFQIE